MPYPTFSFDHNVGPFSTLHVFSIRNEGVNFDIIENITIYVNNIICVMVVIYIHTHIVQR